MTTLTYSLTYPILADSRLEAIMVAGGKLRTGVRVVELVECEQSLPGWWDVRFTVAEDLGANDPPEPNWDLPDGTDHADSMTFAKAEADRTWVQPMTEAEINDAITTRRLPW